MKNLRTQVLALIALLISSQAFAALPSGRFSGYVSNNPFNEWCRLNNATVEFLDLGAGRYQMNWEESGFAQAGGFCQNFYDATFTPSFENEWNVDFAWNNNLIFGRAKLQGKVLTITATYSGFGRPFNSLELKLVLGDDLSFMNYNRIIQSWSGPSLFANGTLYNR